MNKTNVVAAVVVNDGKYLCVQRCRSHQSYNSEHWEFPGGKVEEGESDHEALIREIKEEMDWDIFVGRKICTIEHAYPDFTIRLSAYLCKADDAAFTLLEHLDARWLAKDELHTLQWTEADRKIVEQIQQM